MDEESSVLADQGQLEISSIVQVLDCDVERIQAHLTHAYSPFPGGLRASINEIQEWAIDFHQAAANVLYNVQVVHIGQQTV